MTENPLEILKKWWGYPAFRSCQREIIDSVLSGRDTLAMLPTGGGKSITYQIPALCRDGICIVVTPLIALMKDQVDALRRRGISAQSIHSGLTQRQIDIILDNCAYGDVKFLYVAPERLSTEIFRLRVQKMNVNLIAVDEAHCISQWGYDFRPSYLRIAKLRELCPQTPILALTASATPMVTEDIMHQLKFSEKHIIRSSFSRPNLSYAIRYTEDKAEMMLRVLRAVPGSAIVYVRKRKSTVEVAQLLRENGFSADSYNAGMSAAERNKKQEEWISDKTRIMVATNAFGMGIDKPDVRCVVHWSMCDSLEAYYQEAGRAGRDGKKSYAVLLVSQKDQSLLERMLEQSYPEPGVIKDLYEKLCSFLGVAIGDGKESSFEFDEAGFCKRYNIFSGALPGPIKILEQNGYITYIEPMERKPMARFTVSRDSLYQDRLPNQKMEEILRTMLRIYNGIFSDFRQIDIDEIAQKSETDRESVMVLLKHLWTGHMLRYIPANTMPLIYFNEERLSRDNIYISPQSHSMRLKIEKERLQGMIRYANNESVCRSRMLSRYFGDTEAEPCGICDICRAKSNH